MENRKRGSVLLLALLLLAGVSAASLSVSKNAIDELVAARNLSTASIAYYAAESGVEQGLYLLRKTTERLADFPVSGTLTLAQGSASWKREIPEIGQSESRQTSLLAKDTTWQFDLFDADDSNFIASPVQKLQLSWEGSWLQVSWSAWHDGQWTPVVSKQMGPAQSGLVLTLSTPENERASLFRVRFRALFGDVTNLVVKGLDESGANVKLPDNVVIKAVGSFGQVEQAVAATLPRHSPLSGLYEFVIFSEDSLIKELVQ